MIHTIRFSRRSFFVFSESNVIGHRFAYKSDNIDCLWNARCTHWKRRKNNVFYGLKYHYSRKTVPKCDADAEEEEGYVGSQARFLPLTKI